MGIHQFSIDLLNQKGELKLETYQGKKLLLVNVASKCGFTPQYEGLQKLQDKFGDKIQVIGFPCNQFLWQENASEDKIEQFCQVNYGISFPITTKIKVKGKNKHPIFAWLTQKEMNGKSDYKVKWNFNKFLIDENGQLIEYFGSKVDPLDSQIVNYLN